MKTLWGQQLLRHLPLFLMLVVLHANLVLRLAGALYFCCKRKSLDICWTYVDPKHLHLHNYRHFTCVCVCMCLYYLLIMHIDATGLLGQDLPSHFCELLHLALREVLALHELLLSWVG